jgi:hypothetical protein
VSGLGELLASLLAPFQRARRSVLAGLEDIRRLSARSDRPWHEVASAAGLTALPDSDGVAWGTGSLRVEFSSYRDEEESGASIWISGPTLSTDMTIRPEGRKASGEVAREIEVGDPAFDRVAWVEGPPALVRSLLDADTRRAMRGLLEGRLERPRLTPFWARGRLDDGVLRVDVPEFKRQLKWEIGDDLLAPPPARPADPGQGRVRGSARLPDVLRLVVAVARRLEKPEDVAQRLADNLKPEPVAGVRLQCLTTLAREFRGHPATREALLSAREDPDAEVRLRAGASLGRQGRDVLLAIARGEGAPDETTARAVTELASDLSVDEATSLLRNALRTRRLATARECLGALARRGGARVVPTLAKVLPLEKPELAAAAADALGAAGDASAEAPLLAALGAPNAEVRVAAARALGRVGTTAAVLPLKGLEEHDRSCRAAARQAIAEIQSRLTGAAPGQLSLAGGESGQLSLASEERGRLSLALPSRGASVESGDEGSAVTADPSGPGRRSPSG